jgi:outer membrane protein TolC
MKKTILFIAMLFSSQLLFAQEDTLLYHYRQKALKYQQPIKMAERRLSGSESKVEAAASDLLPRLDFNSKYNYYVEPLQLAPPADGSRPTGEELHNFYALRLELYQPILTGGYLSNNKKAAESEVGMMKNLVNLRKQQVVLNSDLLYWKVVSKKETYRLYTTYKEIIAAFLKVIKDRVEEEVVGKNELYQAQVRLDEAEYKAIRAKKEFMVSLMDLNRLTGVPVNSPSTVSDSLVVVRWSKAGDDMVEKAFRQRPEIALIKEQIAKKKAKEKIAGSSYNPQLGVLAGGKWGSPSPGLQIDPGFNYYFKASLSIPIYRWGKKKEEVFAARQVTEVTRLRLEETKDKVKLEVQSSYYQLERSQEQLDFAASSLKNAARNVSVMLDRYNEGLSSVLEVLDAQLYWQKTYLNYILAKYELNVASSRYLYATGSFGPKTDN